eukprot:4934374-Pyramimonas_sp.AAC.1
MLAERDPERRCKHLRPRFALRCLAQAALTERRALPRTRQQSYIKRSTCHDKGLPSTGGRRHACRVH